MKAPPSFQASRKGYKMTIYEMYGRLLEEREQEHMKHLGTLGLLKSLKAGDIKLDDVEMPDDLNWRIVPTAPELAPYKPTWVPDEPSDA